MNRNDLQRAARQRRRRGSRADDGRARAGPAARAEQQIEVWVAEGVLQPSGAARESWRFARRLARAHAHGDAPDAATSSSTRRASPWRSTCSIASPSSSRACAADRRGGTLRSSSARSTPCEHFFWRFWSRPRPRLGNGCVMTPASGARPSGRAVASAARRRSSPAPTAATPTAATTCAASRSRCWPSSACGRAWWRSTSAPAAATRPSCSRARSRRAAASMAQTPRAARCAGARRRA